MAGSRCLVLSLLFFTFNLQGCDANGLQQLSMLLLVSGIMATCGTLIMGCLAGSKSPKQAKRTCLTLACPAFLAMVAIWVGYGLMVAHMNCKTLRSYEPESCEWLEPPPGFWLNWPFCLGCCACILLAFVSRSLNHVISIFLIAEIPCVFCFARCIMVDAATCVAGEFWNGTQCLECHAGTFTDQAGMRICLPCQPGNFNNQSGSVDCVICPMGSITNVSGATECFTCQPGTHDSVTECELCAAGTFGAEAGLRTCPTCPPGEITNTSGLTACTVCPVGTHDATTRCVVCEPDFFILPTRWDFTYEECLWDADAIIPFMVLMLVLWPASLMWAICARTIHYRFKIVDVYTEKGSGNKRSVLIRSLNDFSGREQHHFSGTGRVPVEFINAEHPSLEHCLKPPVFTSPTLNLAYYRMRWMLTGGKDLPKITKVPESNNVLELLTKEGNSDWKMDVETSTGSIGVWFPFTLRFNGPLYTSALLVAFLLYLSTWLNVPGIPLVLLSLLLRLMIRGWTVFRGLRRSPLDKALKEHTEYLQYCCSTSHCPNGPGRAVEGAQLHKFLETFEKLIGESRNMYYVVSNIIRPLTKPSQLSYAELAGPKRVTWFVSHFWGTSFRHFVKSLTKHAESLWPPEEKMDEEEFSMASCRISYWICSLSNNQWQIQQELGHGEWSQSSFYLALTAPGCRGTAMVMDDAAMPLTRSWCLFEVWQTKEVQQRQKDFNGLWLCTAGGVLHKDHMPNLIKEESGVHVALRIAERLRTLQLQDAQASNAEDKAMIDGLVQQMPGGFDEMNSFVKQNISEAIFCLAQIFTEEVTRLLDDLRSTASTSLGTPAAPVVDPLPAADEQPELPGMPAP
eukprot:s75_g22.t1